MRKLAAMKLERARAAGGTKRFSSATAPTTTSGCCWSMASWPPATLTRACTSRKVGIAFGSYHEDELNMFSHRGMWLCFNKNGRS